MSTASRVWGEFLMNVGGANGVYALVADFPFPGDVDYLESIL